MPFDQTNQIVINIDDDEVFDDIVHNENSLPENGNLHIVTKNNATESGMPLVSIAFGVQLPDGSIRCAQCVTSAKLFIMAASPSPGLYHGQEDGQ